jgi:predicted unusual protein kinase regulating ubiquinone biosynthesis (AarF/ABC1/UbiB family)
LFVIDEPTIAERPRVLFVDFGLSRRLAPELRRALREAILALLQRDLTTFVDRMEAMQMIAPGARPQVERSVSEMFDHVAKGGGALALGGSQLIAVKDRAKQLLRETPGLQLPQDLLLYARTLSYLFALGERLDPQVDLMKLSLPHLLRFLTAKDEPSNVGAD